MVFLIAVAAGVPLATLLHAAGPLPGAAREEQLSGLREVRRLLGPVGAAKRAAHEVLLLLDAPAVAS